MTVWMIITVMKLMRLVQEGFLEYFEVAGVDNIDVIGLGGVP